MTEISESQPLLEVKRIAEFTPLFLHGVNFGSFAIIYKCSLSANRLERTYVLQKGACSKVYVGADVRSIKS